MSQYSYTTGYYSGSNWSSLSSLRRGPQYSLSTGYPAVSSYFELESTAREEILEAIQERLSNLENSSYFTRKRPSSSSEASSAPSVAQSVYRRDFHSWSIRPSPSKPIKVTQSHRPYATAPDLASRLSGLDEFATTYSTSFVDFREVPAPKKIPRSVALGLKKHPGNSCSILYNPWMKVEWDEDELYDDTASNCEELVSTAFEESHQDHDFKEVTGEAHLTEGDTDFEEDAPRKEERTEVYVEGDDGKVNILRIEPDFSGCDVDVKGGDTVLAADPTEKGDAGQDRLSIAGSGVCAARYVKELARSSSSGSPSRRSKSQHGSRRQLQHHTGSRLDIRSSEQRLLSLRPTRASLLSSSHSMRSLRHSISGERLSSAELHLPRVVRSSSVHQQSMATAGSNGRIHSSSMFVRSESTRNGCNSSISSSGLLGPRIVISSHGQSDHAGRGYIAERIEERQARFIKRHSRRSPLL